MRGKIEELVQKITKKNSKYGEEILAIAQTLPPDYLKIDVDEMQSMIDPDEVSKDIKVPEIKI